MHSMTGFGSGKCLEDGREVAVELKSVNHRFLDINQKMPKFISFLDIVARDVISKRISRGHFEVFISYTNQRDDSKKVEVDSQMLSQYMDALNEISKTYRIGSEITFDNIMRMQGVFTVTEQEDDQEAIISIAQKALNEALDNLIVMRKAEGENLHKDIEKRMETVKEIFNVIVDEAPKVPVEYMQKLKVRIRELMSDINFDEARIMTEVAVFADKCNIDEEITRFKSHIMQFEKTIEMNEPVGRKLDFTLQEINREINTIGSKANNATITTAVMDIKAELEKVREQVQNIE